MFQAQTMESSQKSCSKLSPKLINGLAPRASNPNRILLRISDLSFCTANAQPGQGVQKPIATLNVSWKFENEGPPSVLAQPPFHAPTPIPAPTPDHSKTKTSFSAASLQNDTLDGSRKFKRIYRSQADLFMSKAAGKALSNAF